MRIRFKGVFTINEHIEIIAELRTKPEGTWLVDRDPDTNRPRIRGVK